MGKVSSGLFGSFLVAGYLTSIGIDIDGMIYSAFVSIIDLVAPAYVGVFIIVIILATLSDHLETYIQIIRGGWFTLGAVIFGFFGGFIVRSNANFGAILIVIGLFLAGASSV